MGCMTMPLESMGGHRSAKAYLDAQFIYERTDNAGAKTALRVIASACPQNKTYYAAAVPSKNGIEGPALAIVCQVHWNPRAKDGFVFGYKDMDETMGPCETECPERILALLGPTNSLTALMWRKHCFDAIRNRPSKLTDGLHIRFDAPVRFTDGREGQEFIVHKRGRAFALARLGDTRPSYRMAGLTGRRWTEVPHTRVHATTFAKTSA